VHMPVLRPDKKYAGDYKPDPDELLAEIDDVKVDYGPRGGGGNMAVVTAKVHVFDPVVPEEESLAMYMKKHRTPAAVRE